MRIASRILAVAALLIVGSAGASADTTHTYTVGGVDGGTLTITVNSSGTVTSVSGTFDGESITGLLPTGSIGLNDNLFSSTSVFDNKGISFALAGADTDGFDFVNFYDFSGSEYASNQGSCSAAGCGDSLGPSHDFIGDTLTVSSPTFGAPEPSTLALMLFAGVGLLALTLATRKN